MFSKQKLSFVFVLGFVMAASAADQTGGPCETGITNCEAQYSSFSKDGNSSILIKTALDTFTNQMLDKSFRLLFMSSAFNKYDQDRPGFKKLYRKISDKAWEDMVDLIKYESRRGAYVHLKDSKVSTKTFEKLLESNELGSLQTALDLEKLMAQEAHEIHRKVSHDHHSTNEMKIKYDPDVAHYLDEKIISYQSGTIRDLAGYVQTFDRITKGAFNNQKKTEAIDLAVHLFDEYLDKEL